MSTCGCEMTEFVEVFLRMGSSVWIKCQACCELRKHKYLVVD